MNMDTAKLGFIGAGNMASALINGILQSKLIPAEHIFVSDVNSLRLDLLRKTGINIMKDNTNVYRNSDIIILAVKPNVYSLVLKELALLDGIDRKIIVSIAPGISIKYIKSFFNHDMKVIRTMPNTPAQIGEGMTVICYEAPVSEQEYQMVRNIFSSVGQVEFIDEKYLNAAVAVNGSSPAYVYMMIEAMADAAVLRGIPRDSAYRLAAQSVAGAAKMVLETGKHPGELKDMVCSPGGTTIQAVYQLEKSGFRAALMDAMERCTDKAEKMSSSS